MADAGTLPPQVTTFDTSGVGPSGGKPKDGFFVPDNFAGLITFAACAGVLLAWVLGTWLYRVLDRRGRMSEIHAGAFRYAASQGNLVAMTEIEARAPHFDVNVAREGFSALHAASVQGHAAAVEWLLARGAKHKMLKEDGWKDSALHYAAANGHIETVAVLLAYGADPRATNFEECTPADLAKRGGYEDLAALLIKGVEAKNRSATESEFSVQIAPASPGNFLKEVAELGSILNAAREGLELAQIKVQQHSKQKPIASALFKEYIAGNIGEKEVEKQQGGYWDQVKRKGAPGWRANNTGLEPMTTAEITAYMSRGWEGAGSHNTFLRKGWWWFRIAAFLTQSLGIIYMFWRAARTFNPDQLVFSIVFYIAEFVSFIPSFIFCLEIWSPVERMPRNLKTMTGLEEENYPTVDIFICCYSEPADIVEATACAALNIDYPPSKLTVYICDDGRRDDIRAMAHRLEFQRRFLKRQAPLIYSCRTKVKGVSHHAKAGNINNCLLKGGARGDFTVVFDCDMIAKTDFLYTTMGHFFKPKKGGGWEPKEKAAFLQVPQDFYNLVNDDPFGNRARFFYGPMMQGRDGVGSCPCVGTGVIFRREALISLGGQAYGSITEDYNSAMALLGAGFSSMYLNDRLIYGLAPDDIHTVLTQRLRWAMGSLQILCRENPLKKSGLTVPQSLLFYQSAIQYCLSLPTVFMAIIPIFYLFCRIAPIYAKVHEFLAFFIGYYLCNRVMLFLAHRGVPDAGQELWRGSQMWVWLAPNNLQACWKTFTTELAIFKFLGFGKLGFTVTSKGGSDDWKKALWLIWPFLLYYTFLAAGVAYAIYYSVTKASYEEVGALVVALAWAILVCMYVWPPVETVAPSCLKTRGEVGEVLWEQRMAEAEMLEGKGMDADEEQPGSPKLNRQASARSRGARSQHSATSGSVVGRNEKFEEGSIRSEDSRHPEEGAAAVAPELQVWKKQTGVMLQTSQVLPVQDQNMDTELELLYHLVTGQPADTSTRNNAVRQRRANGHQAALSSLQEDGDGQGSVAGHDVGPSNFMVRSPRRRARRGGRHVNRRRPTSEDEYSDDSGERLSGALQSVRRIADEASDYASSDLESERSNHHHHYAPSTRRPKEAAYYVGSEDGVSESEAKAIAEMPEEAGPSALEQFKARMAQRVVFSNAANILARPDFRLTKGGWPHLTFIITNGLLLLGFITGGVLYYILGAPDQSWLGIHKDGWHAT